MQWDEVKNKFNSAISLHRNFYYITPDVTKDDYKPWVNFTFSSSQHQQIGLLGTMEDESQVTSIVHGVNNFIGMPYFWNVEQFLRVCSMNWIIPDYDTAVRELNKGNAIPMDLKVSDWN
jgi:hypothetical protein